MAWFRHHFYCEGCDGTWFAEAWLNEAALAAEADCPFCLARDVFPYRSEDRTLIIEQQGAAFAVLACANTTSSEPAYRRLRRFAERAQAQAYLAAKRA
jgi:hypothetical protein